MKKIITYFFILSLTGCSLASIGYDYADWLIKKRIMEVVKFYSPQQNKLEAHLDKFMAWHRKEMLPVYAADLKDLKSRLLKSEAKPMKAKEVEDKLLLLRSRYYESFLPLSVSIAPLLAELGDEQVTRTQTLLDRKLQDLRDKRKILKKEIIKQSLQTWTDNFEEWLGTLSKEQRMALEAGIGEIYVSPSIRLARYTTRTTQFLAIFENEKALEREKDLKDYFNSWKNEVGYTTWRKKASVLIAKVYSMSDAVQRKTLIRKLDKWIRIIEGLVKDQ